MKITQLHVDFYRSRKTPAHSISSMIVRPRPMLPDQGPSVHALINSQIPSQDRTDPHFHAHNTLASLRMIRARKGAQGVREYLSRTAESAHRAERRGAMCKKWLARIEQQ